ncbi:MAG: hypothetical protein WBE34_14715, partial [Candidatus Nitrosopolaris sp.]
LVVRVTLAAAATSSVFAYKKGDMKKDPKKDNGNDGNIVTAQGYKVDLITTSIKMLQILSVLIYSTLV